jgi:hypothetical protein
MTQGAAQSVHARCDECGCRYHPAASAMSALCAACARRLYGYPPCPHLFLGGRCTLCGWDGSESEFLKADS